MTSGASRAEPHRQALAGRDQRLLGRAQVRLDPYIRSRLIVARTTPSLAIYLSEYSDDVKRGDDVTRQ